MSDQKGLNALPPKTAFILGLGGGVLGLGTLGFIILLSLVLNGEGVKFTLTNKSAKKPVVSTEQAAPPSPSSDPSPSPTRAAGEVPPVTDQDHARGAKKAKVILIEYSDFECPFCKRFHPTMQQIITAYPNDVQWVLRHFPLSFHANAQAEAEATECAAELGGNDVFWSYADKIFERTTSNGTGFALTDLGPLAKELGLDEKKFNECLDSGRYAQYVRDQLNSGAAAGISGTPGTVVIDSDGKSQIIPGALPFESIKQIIDGLL